MRETCCKICIVPVAKWHQKIHILNNKKKIISNFNYIEKVKFKVEYFYFTIAICINKLKTEFTFKIVFVTLKVEFFFLRWFFYLKLFKADFVVFEIEYFYLKLTFIFKVNMYS